jgi:hypothetical protein
LFSRASTVSSSSRLIVEGVFWKSGVVHSFKTVDPILFVFGSHVLYFRGPEISIRNISWGGGEKEAGVYG